ncbi:MAG: YifB family Mg chelatase-like AAA ATPase [Bacteroidales bacterium]|nr:YifB family Mg chelatase-like AAA ATPase [Bacteroidales bacterium]
MSLAIIHSRSKQGIQAPAIAVEVHLSNGLPSLNIVGMAETAVKESKDRVRSALLNAHFDFPQRRITISLAPADVPKEGSRYDLAIALGILAASGQVPATQLDHYEFVGELALSGELRPVDGLLPSAIACGQAGRRLVIPADNGDEAALAHSTTVYPARHLLEVCAHLRGAALLAALPPGAPPAAGGHHPDLADVIGQHQARRALEVAAAGGHNLLFVGPPGTGKTLLASRLPGIMPALDEEEALEVASVYSVAGLGLRAPFHQPPFRAPHHTASPAALVGGGGVPRPGEISLAHRGVLFLDELPEFPRRVLEVLREPLESGEIHLSRARAQISYPSRFQLVAAMNPCPCGYLGSEKCHCTPDQVRRYSARVSGPLLDRIDIQLKVLPIPHRELIRATSGDEGSAPVRQRVLEARRRQQHRQGKVNAALTAEDIKRHCVLGEVELLLLEDAVERLGLSARGYHRVLKVARTIADLAGADALDTTHLGEALGYRFER